MKARAVGVRPVGSGLLAASEKFTPVTLRRMATELEVLLATARSSFESPSMSAAAIANGLAPAGSGLEAGLDEVRATDVLEDRDVRAQIDDGEIDVVVAVEVAGGERDRVRPHRLRAGCGLGELPRSVVGEDADVVGAVVGDREVLVGVAVEVRDHDRGREGADGHRARAGLCEVAVARVAEDGHAGRLDVGDREVDVRVTVEVGGGDRRRAPVRRPRGSTSAGRSPRCPCCEGW